MWAHQPIREDVFEKILCLLVWDNRSFFVVLCLERSETNSLVQLVRIPSKNQARFRFVVPFSSINAQKSFRLGVGV